MASKIFQESSKESNQEELNYSSSDEEEEEEMDIESTSSSSSYPKQGIIRDRKREKQRMEQRERIKLFESLIEFFPKEIIQPKYNLIDLINYF